MGYGGAVADYYNITEPDGSGDEGRGEDTFLFLEI